MIFDETVFELEEVTEEGLFRPRILIIDDEPDQTDALAYRLSQLGFEPQVATNCAAGMVAADMMHPHLIILDVCLPDGNGLELCQRLTDDATTCDIPIIILSGMEGPDLVRQARSAGCHFYVRKPYDPNVLLALIRESIGIEEVDEEEP